MKREVGIGVCTYNRAKYLGEVLRLLLLSRDPDTEVVVADDGSSDETKSVVQSFGLEYLGGNNLGISGNKNRILRRLGKKDYIFLIEDDVKILRKGWENFFIEACEKSGVEHFTFSPPGRYGRVLGETAYDGTVIQHSEFDGGCFLFITGRALSICGGFDERFKGYGFEHCEFSERVFRFGLSGRERINNVKGSGEYVSIWEEVPKLIGDEERDKQGAINWSLWQKIRAENQRGFRL